MSVSTTIAELRVQAGAFFRLPASELQLFWKGGELTAAQIAQLQPGDMIQVNQRQEGDIAEPLPRETTHNTVLVLMHDRATRTVHVTPTETVGSLIAKLEVAIRPDQICELVYNDVILKKNQLLSELELADKQDKVILALQVKLIGGISNYKNY